MKNHKTRLDIIQRNDNRNRGFTLVEVLVVITIIVVLAALVVVVTRNIKNKAFQANAMASLRQVAARFDKAYVRKPEASRDRSREVFVVGKGFRGCGTAA